MSLWQSLKLSVRSVLADSAAQTFLTYVFYAACFFVGFLIGQVFL